jgi:hypothetical protein
LRPTTILVFVATFFASSAAFAVPIHVQTNEYTTSWWWGPAGGALNRELGDSVIDVPPGDFVVRVGWEGGFDGHVDASGNVSIRTPSGVGVDVGQNSLEFRPIRVEVRANGYETNYIAPGVGSTNGDSTIWVVPGTAGNYSINLDHDTPGASVRFTVSAEGLVTPVNDSRGDYSQSIDGGPQSLSFKTVAARIDPGAYTGSMRFVYDTEWYGARDLHFVKSTAMSLGFPYDRLRIEIAADGTITTALPGAATISGTTISLNTSPLHVEPGAYDSTYHVYRRLNEPYHVAGPMDFAVIRGLRWGIFLFSNRFVFDVAGDGSLSGRNPATFSYDGTTLRFNNVPITVDPGNFRFAWTTLFNQSNYPDRNLRFEGPQTFQLPPGTSWRFRLVEVSGWINVTIDDSGRIGSFSPAAAGDVSESTLRLRTVPIAIDPGAYVDRWFFLRGASVTEAWYGPTTFDVVPGLDYRISDPVGGYSPFFSVFEPCAASPSIVGTGNADYSISCDVGPADGDGDGVPDDADNCADVANPGQVDRDSDGTGDACDADIDGDGVENQNDNCAELPNSDQLDVDGDGIGDGCDSDTDGDSVPDEQDNCIFTSNTDQADSDGDQLGDACDADDDNDGILDASDNCPLVSNPTQSDVDSDAIGDACDADTDGDGVLNEHDVCAESPKSAPVDLRGCTGAQLIDLQCDRGGFATRGRYVSCVAKVSKTVRDAGLISQRDRARFIREAAKSNRGR